MALSEYAYIHAYDWVYVVLLSPVFVYACGRSRAGWTPTDTMGIALLLLLCFMNAAAVMPQKAERMRGRERKRERERMRERE